MEVFDYESKRSLASVILWQYENAENLQKLIWHTVRKIKEDGTYTDEQNGILQSMLDAVDNGLSDFYTYIFSALTEAEKYPNTMETDRPDDKNLQKLFFGLTVWSKLVGKARPQYTVTAGGVTTKVNVHLLAWARYLKAEIGKVFSRGTCKDINRYVKTLLPHYNVYVIDGGGGMSADYMTQAFKYRPDLIYSGTAVYEKPPSEISGLTSDYSVEYVIDTEISSSGFAKNEFASVVAIVNGTRTALTRNTSTRYVKGDGSLIWELNSTTGVYEFKIQDGESRKVRTPSAYLNASGEPQVLADGVTPNNILKGAPNLTNMMSQLQYVDEYDLIMADRGTLTVGSGSSTVTYKVDSIFPHPAGVLSRLQENEVVVFGNISDYIGLNVNQTTGQNAAVLNNGILFEEGE